MDNDDTNGEYVPEKVPTEKEELAMYRGFLHDLNMFASITMDGHAVHELVGKACDWSYAHRVGNGMLTDEEQEQIVSRNFWKLRDISPHEHRHKEMMQRTTNQLRECEIIHVAKELLSSVSEKYKIDHIDSYSCPIMKRLHVAINGTDDEMRKQVSDSFGERYAKKDQV